MSNTQPFVSQNTYFSDENTVFKLAISTGNFLGFANHHPIRNLDSFDSFEEVLKRSREANSDMLLLGGNMFDESSPSQDTLYKAISILKENIFGDKAINYEVIWDQHVPNYACENMNIDLPIFIIHGKRECDDVNVLDVLHAGNYLNNFGKHEQKEHIEITPILIHKEETKIALYGIGHLKENVFQENWKSQNIHFLKPTNSEEYFNILVLHQNPKNFEHTPESAFFNLIIWGSTSESIPKIEMNEEIGMHVYKPGSSLITTYDESESRPKHLGILKIRRKEFLFEPIFLKDSHRELVMKEIEMSKIKKNRAAVNAGGEEEKKNFKGFDEDETEFFIEEEINNLLKEYQSRVFDREIKKLPIIRLKVEYSGFNVIRIQRLESKFKNKVANQGEILKFWKKKNNAATAEMLQKNINLTENFEQCFRSKIPFNTIGKEAVSDLRQIYEKDLSNHTLSLMPPSLFLEKIDHLNFRNRNTYFSEFFSEVISKISNELVYDEKASVYSINNKYAQKSQYTLKKFKSTLASAAFKRQAQSRAEPSIINQDLAPEFDITLENFDYESEMKAFFENLLKGSLTNKSINIVAKIFKEFGVNELERFIEKNPNASAGVVENKSNKKGRKKGLGLQELKKKTGNLPLKTTNIGEIQRKNRDNEKKRENQEEGSPAMKKEEEIVFFASEKKRGRPKISNFLTEKNEKKRKISEGNKQFSEFLEKNTMDLEGENSKKKKSSRGFL